MWIIAFVLQGLPSVILDDDDRPHVWESLAAARAWAQVGQLFFNAAETRWALNLETGDTVEL